MNQILYTGDKKNKEAMDIKKVVRIFAIGILVFGIICFGEGSYGIVKVIEERNNRIVDPNVTLKQAEEVLILKIEHNTAIDKIIYSWNNEAEITLQGMGRKSISEQIAIPTGENTISIKIIDNKNHEVTYTNTYVNELRDKIAPEIEFLIENGKIKIVAKDETAIDHIDYYWNEEDATTLNARNEEQKTIEEKISILKGENTLTVIAVDLEGNETIKEQTYIGARKPVIETYEKDNFLIIKVSDEQGIQKVEYDYKDVKYSSDKENPGEPLNYKLAYCKQELSEGNNHFAIRAYNINGLVTEITVDINK